MADLSASFNPALVATTSDAASDAASKATVAQSTASDAASAAVVAQSKASDASSAAVVAGKRCVILKVYAEGTAIAAGDGAMFFTVPSLLNGMNLTSVGGHLYTAATSGVVQVQIRNATSAVDMLKPTRLLEWDATEKDTATAAASSVATISTANDGVATGEELAVDIDAAASGAKGLEVRLTFATP